MPSAKKIDRNLLLTAVCLTFIGLVMIFSASYVKSGMQYFLRQFIWALAGYAALSLGILIDYRRLQKLSGLILAGSVLLLLFVGVNGHVANGAKSWLILGPLRFQPSEFAKMAVVIYMAAFIADNPRRMSSLQRGFLPMAAMAVGVFALILWQPDLGTGMIVLIITFLMLAAGGTKGVFLAGTAACSIPLTLMAWFFILKDYQKARIFTFMNPQADPQNGGYQIIQSLIALGSGGLFGAGFGHSKQKFFYLPENHTDFIFAIIGEELGLIGAAVVICLFMIYVWRGYAIALKSQDRFGAMLAFGLTSMTACQAIINIAVVASCLPVTGITLPFISYGGSSLLLTMFATGLILSVSRHGGRVHVIEGGNSRRRHRRTHLSGAGSSL